MDAVKIFPVSSNKNTKFYRKQIVIFCVLRYDEIIRQIYRNLLLRRIHVMKKPI